MKKRENYYDYVLINGVQNKRIVKSCQYNKRTGVLKKAIVYRYHEIFAKQTYKIRTNIVVKKNFC